jgi:hypothetical protein
MIPSFTTFNRSAAMFLSGFIILAVYYTNTWNTGHLPILSNDVFDHFGASYNISRVVDERGIFNLEKYMAYSAPYISGALAVSYFCIFAMYASILTYVWIFYRRHAATALKNVFNSLTGRTKFNDYSSIVYQDVHNRLMGLYPEGKKERKKEKKKKEKRNQEILAVMRFYCN